MAGERIQIPSNRHCITILLIGSVAETVHLSIAHPLLRNAASTSRTLKLPIGTNPLLTVFTLVRSIGTVRIVVALPAVRNTLGGVQTLKLVRLAMARTVHLVRTQTSDRSIQTVVFVVTSPVLWDAMAIVTQELIRRTCRHDRSRTILLIAVIPTIVFSIANPRRHVTGRRIWALKELSRVHCTAVTYFRTTDLIRGIRTVRVIIATHLIRYTQSVVAAELCLRIARTILLVTSIATVLDIVAVL